MKNLISGLLLALLSTTADAQHRFGENVITFTTTSGSFTKTLICGEIGSRVRVDGTASNGAIIILPLSSSCSNPGFLSIKNLSDSSGPTQVQLTGADATNGFDRAPSSVSGNAPVTYSVAVPHEGRVFHLDPASGWELMEMTHPYDSKRARHVVAASLSPYYLNGDYNRFWWHHVLTDTQDIDVILPDLTVFAHVAQDYPVLIKRRYDATTSPSSNNRLTIKPFSSSQVIEFATASLRLWRDGDVVEFQGDPSGHWWIVNARLQPVRLSVQSTSGQTIYPGYNQLTYNNTLLNDGAWFASDTWTVDAEGTCWLKALASDSDSLNLFLEIRKNGSGILQNRTVLSDQIEVPCSPGDYFTTWVYNNTGNNTTLTSGGYQNLFQAELRR